MVFVFENATACVHMLHGNDFLKDLCSPLAQRFTSFGIKILVYSKIVAILWLSSVSALGSHMIPRLSCALYRRLSELICESQFFMGSWRCLLSVCLAAYLCNLYHFSYLFSYEAFLLEFVLGMVAFRSLDDLSLLQLSVISN